MSTVAISQLPAAVAAAPTDEIPIVQGGVTKKLTNALLFSTTSLASATGLPIDAGTTGTLPVARGGTGGTTSTGTGAVVLAVNPTLTNPTMTTPALGVASATTINKLAITAPVNGATLTIADNKALTVNNSLTLVGTDSTTMTFPTTNATLARTDAAQTFIGAQTFSGHIVGSVQALSGAGAVNITDFTTAFTSTATGNALTLANGAAGQIKTVVYVAEAAGADTGILTPTTRVGYSTITFTNVGDSVTLQYFTQGWAVIGVRGATVA